MKSDPPWPRGEERARQGWLGDVGVIIAAAALAPATLAAQNAVFGPDVRKLSGIALGQVLGGLGIATISKRFGLGHRVAVVISAALVVAFTLGGGLVRSADLGIVVLACVAFSIALVLGGRLSRDDRSWAWLGNTAWLLVIVMVGRAAFAVVVSVPSSAASSSSSELSRVNDVGISPVNQSFYVIFLDGYPGSFSEMPELAPVVEEFVAQLVNRGFQRTRNARANYNATYASISTALSLDHLLTLSSRGLVDAFDRIRGNNRLVREAKHAGYRYVHIESGFSGSTCGRSVDHCYKGLLFDDTVEALLDLSIFEAFWRQSASTAGALNALDDLSAHIAEDDGGDFVFAHVLLPHPPVQLTRDCERTLESHLNVLFLNSPDTSKSELRLIKDAFLEQVQCVNSLVLGLVDRLPQEWPVVVTSDHGTDFRGQALKVPRQWNEEDIVERFTNFNVTRLPGSCPTGPYRDLVNIMRSAASCVFGIELRPVASQYQIVPYYGSLEIGARVLTEAELGF